jgi:hypothetical protein
VCASNGTSNTCFLLAVRDPLAYIKLVLSARRKKYQRSKQLHPGKFEG